MPPSPAGSPGRPFQSVWISWITALALVFLAAAANTSFTASGRVASEGRTSAAWVTYRPWKLSHGRAAGWSQEAQPPAVPDAWCARAAMEGSTPWGRRTVELVTCIRPHRHPQGSGSAAWTAGPRNEELSP